MKSLRIKYLEEYWGDCKMIREYIVQFFERLGGSSPGLLDLKTKNTMRQLIIIILILTVLNKVINAQEIVTDRPDQTESSTTIPNKSFQMEMGFGSGNYNNERLSLLPYALSFAAGAMIFVVVEELIPESQTGNETDLSTIGAMLGFATMMMLDVALG